MILPVVLVIAIALFFVQLFCCIKVKHPVLRLLPVYLSGGFELLCIAGFFLGKLLTLEMSLTFPAFILGYIGCYWCAGAVLAWGIHSLVKTIQKRRK